MSVPESGLVIPDIGSLESLQELYDNAFPGNSLVDDEFDGYLVQTSDLTIDAQDSVIPIFSKDGVIESKPAIKSRVRTAMPARRVQCDRENLIAVVKRNWDTPDVSEIVNYDEIISSSVDKFFSTYTIPELVDSSEIFTESNAVEWFNKQIGSTKGKIIRNEDFLDEMNHSKYNFMIKCDVKPKLDLSPQSEYAALQTVIFHGKEKNFIWGPIFHELTIRLLQCLKPNVIVNTKLSADQLTERFAGLNHLYDLAWYEMDLSKYDKSQGYIHQQVEMEIWERLGLEKSLRDLWERGHVSTSFSDLKSGFRSWLMYQRKSGDVTTFIGNTLVNMVVLADSLPIDKAYFSMFGGDDSLIGFPKEDLPNLIDPCYRVASVWNFQCKLFQFNLPSFCGKVLLRDNLGWVLVPDPLKLITKLGATKALNEKELEEVRISYWDNYKGLDNFRVIQLLREYLIERYKVTVDPTIALCSLVKFLKSPEAFKTLFFVENLTDVVRDRSSIVWN